MDKGIETNSIRNSEVILTRLDNLLEMFRNVSDRISKHVYLIIPSSPVGVTEKKKPEQPKGDHFVNRISDKLDRLEHEIDSLRSVISDLESF